MKKLLLRFWLGCLVAGLYGPLRAQTLDPGFAAVSMYRLASIEAAAQQPDGKIVVSGSFIRVNGTATSGIVRLNVDGTLDPTFSSSVQGSAQSLAVLANGQVLAWSYTAFSVGGQPYNGLLKLNADGTLASGFSAGSGPGGGIARAMTVQADGKILLGGSFTTYNGVAARGLVRLNTDGSVDQAFATALGTGFDADVFVVKAHADGKVLAGGRFTNFNGSGRRHLVRLLSTGALDTGYTPLTNASNPIGVLHLALDPTSGKAVAVGLGTSTLLPVRLNLDGSTDMTFQAGTVSPACGGTSFYNNNQLQIDGGGNVLLGRACGTASGNNYLTRYLNNGAIDSQFNLQNAINGAVNVVLPLLSGQTLVGGSFSQFLNLDNVNLLMVNSQAVPSSTFRPVLDGVGTVSKVLRQANGKLLVGGNFREVNGQTATGLVRLSTDGTLDASFGRPVIDGPVEAMALQPDGKVVVAGLFSTAAGTYSPGLIRLTTTGAADATFQNPSLTPPVYSTRTVAVQPDGKILLSTSGGVTFGGRTAALHRFSATGAPDAAYGQAVGTISGVNDIVVLPDGRHYLAGTFSSFGGVPAEGLVRLLPSGSPDPTFVLPTTAASPSPTVTRVFVADDGQLTVGGYFSAYRGLARTNLVRLQSDGQPDPSLNASLLGSTIPLFLQADGKVILGSYGPHSVGGVNQGSLSRLNADGSLDNTFVGGPALTNGTVVTAAAQPNGKLVIGGTFTTVAGQTRMGVTRLDVPNILRVTPAQATARTAAWPVPAHGTLHLRLDAALRPQQLALYDALGRRVLARPAGSAAEQTLSVRGVKPGVYLLRVDYANVSATRRVVVE